ncbi:MAG: hypothetical protein NTW87_24705 [Planctomycetota bacterium]|nr:hypothetical protein [Planctomycetota bacterium]
MARNGKDARVLRDLAKQYRDLAEDPIQQERRALWRRHNSLKPTRPLVLATYGMWNVWCREVFGDHAMRCADPFLREHERNLRMQIFHHSVGDDYILEPWITQRASVQGAWRALWGLPEANRSLGVEGGAWKFDPPIKDWAEARKLSHPPHVVDEAQTAENAGRLRDVLGGILEVDVDRSPACLSFMADISTSLAGLRGLEQMMLDMLDAPAQLHALLAFMRDGILANQQAAEDAGDFGLTSQHNQCMPYAAEVEALRPNSGPRRRKQLWAFSAAQEFTLISPRMHDEFLLQYQLPILKHFALSAYGCCEDLTPKIAMLRQIPNLRIIAVAPRADVRRCAEQIGRDYVISWRPNPTDMVCAGFDAPRIRRTIREGLRICRGLHVHLHLKDIETVEGQPERLARWVRIVRDAM